MALPFKVLDMIVGSGILRSGGKMTCVMAISLVVFERRSWMNQLKA